MAKQASIICLCYRHRWRLPMRRRCKRHRHPSRALVWCPCKVQCIWLIWNHFAAFHLIGSHWFSFTAFAWTTRIVRQETSSSILSANCSTGHHCCNPPVAILRTRTRFLVEASSSHHGTAISQWLWYSETVSGTWSLAKCCISSVRPCHVCWLLSYCASTAKGKNVLQNAENVCSSKDN